MPTQDIFALGSGLQSPWVVDERHLDTTAEPYTLNLRLGAARGSLYPCPVCGELRKAHYFQGMALAGFECPGHGQVAVSHCSLGRSYTRLLVKCL